MQALQPQPGERKQPQPLHMRKRMQLHWRKCRGLHGHWKRARCGSAPLRPPWADQELLQLEWARPPPTDSETEARCSQLVR